MTTAQHPQAEPLPVYQAIPSLSRFTIRHEKALKAAGFKWTGYAWLREGKPGLRPWGCKVRKYKPPKPIHWFDKAVGIMTGELDEFGKTKGK